jgi:hypothetical protein
MAEVIQLSVRSRRPSRVVELHHLAEVTSFRAERARRFFGRAQLSPAKARELVELLEASANNLLSVQAVVTRLHTTVDSARELLGELGYLPRKARRCANDCCGAPLGATFHESGSGKSYCTTVCWFAAELEPV